MNDGWPWFFAFGFLILFELWAVASERRTLSQRARDAARRYPWLPWAVILATVVLYGHFWWGWLW